MNLYIFIRTYNDIDHIVPVVYYMHAKDPSVHTMLVNTSFVSEFSRDYRILLLKEKFGVRYVDLTDFGTGYDSLFRWFIKIHDAFRKHNNSTFWDKVYRKVVLGYLYLPIMNRYLRSFRFEMLLDQNGQPQVFGFDHGLGLFIERALGFAEKKGVKTFSYPHGLNFCLNDLISVNIKDVAKVRGTYGGFNRFDRIFVNNTKYRDRFIRYGVREEKLSVTGSARYTHLWSRLLDEITPRTDLPKVETSRLKIVFMLSKTLYNIFEEEVLRMIELALSDSRTFVVVKPQTREVKYYFGKEKGFNFKHRENLLIVDETVHSHDLIQWADLVVFNLSSIILDTLTQDKPALFLRRTIANKMIFEEAIKSWNVDCRDDLAFWIERLCVDKNARTYSKEEAKAVLDMAANDGDGQVLERYANEIFSLTT